MRTHEMKFDDKSQQFLTYPFCNGAALTTFTLFACEQQFFNPQCRSTNVQPVIKVDTINKRCGKKIKTVTIFFLLVKVNSIPETHRESLKQ